MNATHLEKLDFNGETSDEEIAQVVSEMEGYKLLKIVERISESGTVYAKYAYVKAPDNQTQDKALDKAYKIKGSYAPEKSININVDVDSESRRKGQEAIKQFLSK